MEIQTEFLRDGKFTTEKKQLSSLQILCEKPNISFSVRITNNDGLAPHLGFKTFKNVKSKSLRKCVELLYEVVGQLCCDEVIRCSINDSQTYLKDLQNQITQYEKEIDESKTNFDKAKSVLKSLENLPNMRDVVGERLSELKKDFEEYKIKLVKLKNEFEETSDEILRDVYLEEVKNFRIKQKELNNLVDIVNDKYEKILNAKVLIDRYKTKVKIAKICRMALLEKAININEKLDLSNAELIYTSQRLELEEDHEL